MIIGSYASFIQVGFNLIHCTLLLDLNLYFPFGSIVFNDVSIFCLRRWFEALQYLNLLKTSLNWRSSCFKCNSVVFAEWFLFCSAFWWFSSFSMLVIIVLSGSFDLSQRRQLFWCFSLFSWDDFFLLCEILSYNFVAKRFTYVLEFFLGFDSNFYLWIACWDCENFGCWRQLYWGLCFLQSCGIIIW